MKKLIVMGFMVIFIFAAVPRGRISPGSGRTGPAHGQPSGENLRGH